MSLGEQDLKQVVTSVWETMLGLHAEPTGQAVHLDGDRYVTGRTEITGPWEGVVMLSCPAALARHSAAGVFETPTSEVTSEQMCDVVGELTNILAGNLKALLPESSQLGLPHVTEEVGDGADVAARRALARADFQSRGQVFALCLLKREQPPSPQ
jgi:chemotaxis protein CheX